MEKEGSPAADDKEAEGNRSRCVFCGERKRSLEHVLPQWLRRTPTGQAALLENRRGAPRKSKTIQRVTAGVAVGEDPFLVVVPEQRGVPTLMLETQVRAPCRGCNQGWMSQLERQAAPILRPLMAGTRGEVSAEESSVLARWAAKTAAMYEFDDPASRRFDDSVLTAIHQDAHLPGAWRFWAFLVSDPPRAGYFRLSHEETILPGWDAESAQWVFPGAPVVQSTVVLGRFAIVLRATPQENPGVPLSVGLGLMDPHPALISNEESGRSSILPTLTFAEADALIRGRSSWMHASRQALDDLLHGG